MKIETEIKIKIENIDKIQKQLEELKAKSSSWSFERTYGFFTFNKSNVEDGIFPRIKVKDGIGTLGVKVRQESLTIDYFKREEYETPISNIEQSIGFLRAFGYTKIIIFEKLRQHWKIGNVEICLDRLPFGNYIEIEGEEQDIENMVKLLKLQDEPRITVAYLILFDEWKKQNNSEAIDAIFGGI